MNEVFYLPMHLDKTALCFYNDVKDEDDFDYWCPMYTRTPTVATRNLKETGNFSWGTCCGEGHDSVTSSSSSSSSSSPSSCSSGQKQKSLWLRWLSTLMRLRKLKKKMLGVEMGCLQRLRHRLRRLKKVLYVCEGMSGSVGEAMAAARDRATRYQSVQQDFALGLPHQVRRPDGEERRHCTMKPFAATSDSQEAETTREYIKPPPNKTLFDVPPRSYSMGMLNRDWDVVSSGMHSHQQHHHNHYSAPLDPAGSAASSSSSSSPSSSWPSWGSGDESSRGSPRRVRKTLGFGQKGSPSLLSNCIAPFTSPKNERAPQSPQDGGRRAHRHQGVSSSGTLLSSQDQYCPGGSTWSEITTVSVPCGSSHSPNYPSGSGASQGTLGSGMGVPGDPPHLYEQSSQLGCSAPADHELPPLYSEVIENPTVCRSVSRPSEQRTNSGKI